MTRILIADGYPAESVARTRERGGRTSADDIFPEVLARHASDLDCTTLSVAEGERLPQGVILDDFDGIAITGSPLSAYETDEPRVARQISFARDAFESGVPVWGSCWGMQVAAAALGGTVRLNPRGYEIGIGRAITLSEEGRRHLLYRDKGPSFDAVTVHHDEVERMPADAVLLASNTMSRVQAMAVDRDGMSFWGVQYHPEFDLAHVAFLMAGRPQRLVAEGLARDEGDVAVLTSDFAALGHDPSRRDLAWRYGIGADVLDADLRTREFRNWLAAKVAPRRAARAAARAPDRTHTS
ncbi:MAG: type 1 glutamine amidotransferase [Hyphomicrobiaceae bacterium]